MVQIPQDTNVIPLSLARQAQPRLAAEPFLETNRALLNIGTAAAGVSTQAARLAFDIQERKEAVERRRDITNGKTRADAAIAQAFEDFKSNPDNTDAGEFFKLLPDIASSVTEGIDDARVSDAINDYVAGRGGQLAPQAFGIAGSNLRDGVLAAQQNRFLVLEDEFSSEGTSEERKLEIRGEIEGEIATSDVLSPLEKIQASEKQQARLSRAAIKRMIRKNPSGVEDALQNPNLSAGLSPEEKQNFILDAEREERRVSDANDTKARQAIADREEALYNELLVKIRQGESVNLADHATNLSPSGLTQLYGQQDRIAKGDVPSNRDALQRVWDSVRDAPSEAEAKELLRKEVANGNINPQDEGMFEGIITRQYANERTIRPKQRARREVDDALDPDLMGDEFGRQAVSRQRIDAKRDLEAWFADNEHRENEPEYDRDLMLKTQSIIDSYAGIVTENAVPMFPKVYGFDGDYKAVLEDLTVLDRALEQIYEDRARPPGDPLHLPRNQAMAELLKLNRWLRYRQLKQAGKGDSSARSSADRPVNVFAGQSSDEAAQKRPGAVERTEPGREREPTPAEPGAPREPEARREPTTQEQEQAREQVKALEELRRGGGLPTEVEQAITSQIDEITTEAGIESGSERLLRHARRLVEIDQQLGGWFIRNFRALSLNILTLPQPIVTRVIESIQEGRARREEMLQLLRGAGAPETQVAQIEEQVDGG